MNPLPRLTIFNRFGPVKDVHSRVHAFAVLHPFTLAGVVGVIAFALGLVR